MKLFSEIKNKYYDIIADFIFLLYDAKTIKERDLLSLTSSELKENLSLANSLLNQSGPHSLFIFNGENDEYSLSLDSDLPIIPSKIEKTWLKYMLNQDKAEIFLNKKTIDKLLLSLEKYENIFENNIIIKHSDNRPIEDYADLKGKINILIEAIRGNKLIKYSYKTRCGTLLADKISAPYKIEYSIKKDIFYLISYSLEEKRPIKSILENFKNIRILEIENPVTKGHIKDSIKAKKQDKYVVVQLENINNLIERGFLTFSSYSTETKYIEKKDIHELKIFYYSFEEKEIINKIFSLGKGVIVKEPEYIREKIIERIEESLILYEESLALTSS